MVGTDGSGAWARQRLEQIQREQGERVAKVRQKQQEIDDLEAQEIPLAQRLHRASSFDPSRGICPRCAIDNGEIVKLNAIPTAAIVIEGVQRDVDLMQCPVCCWDDTVQVT